MQNVSKQQSTNAALDGSVTTVNGPVMNILSKGGMVYLEKRGISPETAQRYHTYTEKGALVTPFLEDGKIVNREYRTRDKKFWRDNDGKMTFWNVDAIDDAIEFNLPLLICEGPMDALSAIEAGHVATVSVPAGAPPAKSDDDIEIEHDNKFAYIWDLQEKLNKIKQFILAGDNDKAGQALNHELQRRLGVERCRFVKNARKDLNEVLVEDGPEKLMSLIHEAPKYPVKGLYQLYDYPDKGMPVTYSTGIMGLDDNLMIELGRLMVITGIPSHGKSEVADRIIFNMAKNYGWHSCVASFENAPTPNWRDSMRRKLTGGNPYYLPAPEKQRCDDWIQRQFSFIGQHPNEEFELTLEDILEAAYNSIIRYGSKILLIDPWNEIEHKRRRDETGTEYISRALRRLKSFAREHDVLPIIVAHPSKMNDKGIIKKPSPYDISGSSTWYDKSDYCVIVHRHDITKTAVELDVRKIKFQQYAGRPAVLDYDFNPENGDYAPDIEARDMKSGEELFKKN